MLFENNLLKDIALKWERDKQTDRASEGDGSQEVKKQWQGEAKKLTSVFSTTAPSGKCVCGLHQEDH